ncbi:unnamed protein product [Gongylonema pulchrum]|uniref:Uncharacterized protein n=1 Tax=Gongylonema pulchrum TaxID=637853 RepID=A0A183E4J9_9BILA|nr:unnamed protein product [Gongylonema pulchrum]
MTSAAAHSHPRESRPQKPARTCASAPKPEQAARSSGAVPDRIHPTPDQGTEELHRTGPIYCCTEQQ